MRTLAKRKGRRRESNSRRRKGRRRDNKYGMPNYGKKKEVENG